MSNSVEYSIKGGKVEHLISEYSGRNQEKAVPNTHTPPDCTTEFCITFQNDAELEVKIAPNGVQTRSGAEVVKIEEWDYRRTILRQDEVAEFIRSRKGEKYSALLPLLGLHELEITAENLRKLARSIERQSGLGQKKGALEQVLTKRRQFFGRDADATIEAKLDGLYRKYCPELQATGALHRCAELEVALEARIEALTAENQRYLALEALGRVEILRTVKAVRQANARLAGSVEFLISEKLSVLQSASDFAENLKDADTLNCPACGQSISADEFRAHIKAEEERLAELIAIFEERRRAVSELIDAVKTLKATLTKVELAGWRAEASQAAVKHNFQWIEQCVPEAYRQSLIEDDLTGIETHCPPIIEAGNGATHDMPPQISELNTDKSIVDAAKSVFNSRARADEIERINNLMAFISRVEVAVRAEIRERTNEVIGEISGEIGAMWKTLHPTEPIDEVRLYLPENDKAIDIALRFHGKEQDSPRLTLSEGYRNSLGLCIFLALAKREAVNDRPLILDDVVVSLDRNHRGMIVDLLKSQFADRQVIIFTHDRDWFAELRHQLNSKRWNFKSLLPVRDTRNRHSLVRSDNIVR